jgi:large subunit ribosomal protein L29
VKAQDWQQMRELGLPELRDRKRELDEQLFRFRLSKSLGQIDNALKVRETRRTIARVNTLIREKELASAKPVAAASAQR